MVISNINIVRRNNLVEVLSCVLNELCLQNDPLDQSHPFCRTFCSITPPLIKIQPYLQRIANYSGCSEESFVFSLIYLDRLIKKSKFMVTSKNVHRLILTSILIAVKFYDDQYYSNKHWCNVGGVSIKELNNMEIKFLIEIQFELFVTSQVYKLYNKKISETAISQQPKKLKPVQPDNGVRRIQAFGSHLYRKPSVPVRNFRKYKIVERSEQQCSEFTFSKPLEIKELNNYAKKKHQKRMSPVLKRCGGVTSNSPRICKPLIGSA